MTQDVSNYWDGESKLCPGLVVKYIGKGASDYYTLPEHGQLVTLLAQDIQMGSNPVWICRWYDEDKAIQLVPLMAPVLARAEDPIDPRVEQVADRYYQWTGVDLDLKYLQKSLAFLFEKSKNEPVLERVDFEEVTILNNGGFSILAGVQFPITLKLFSHEYERYACDSVSFGVLGKILNLLPGVNPTEKFVEDEFYIFFINEEIICKE